MYGVRFPSIASFFTSDWTRIQQISVTEVLKEMPSFIELSYYYLCFYPTYRMHPIHYSHFVRSFSIKYIKRMQILKVNSDRYWIKIYRITLNLLLKINLIEFFSIMRDLIFQDYWLQNLLNEIIHKEFHQYYVLCEKTR